MYYYYNVDATWDTGNQEYQYFLKGYKNFTNHESDGSFKETSFTKVYPVKAHITKPAIISSH